MATANKKARLQQRRFQDRVHNRSPEANAERELKLADEALALQAQRDAAANARRQKDRHKGFPEYRLFGTMFGYDF